MKKNTLKKNNKGFSLVELIVVICIMAVLVAILAPQFMKFVGQSKVSADAQQLEEVETNLSIMATELPADTYTVTIPYKSGTATIKSTSGSNDTVAQNLFAEYAGANWTTTTAMKSDTYATGAIVTMSINPTTFQTTITSAVAPAPAPAP